jgi:hypothetical protein
MKKTNGTFKLEKSTKRTLALMTGEARAHWKRMMIDAQVSEEKAKLAKNKERSNSNQGDE